MTQLVVVADDDTLTRVIASRMLRHAGYAVASVAGAHEVIQLALHAEPAALLLDVLLGGYDASTLVPLLRASSDARTRALPVILMSVHPELEEAGRACGADAWLPKPLHAPALLAALERLGVRPEGPSSVSAATSANQQDPSLSANSRAAERAPGAGASRGQGNHPRPRRPGTPLSGPD